MIFESQLYNFWVVVLVGLTLRESMKFHNFVSRIDIQYTYVFAKQSCEILQNEMEYFVIF